MMPGDAGSITVTIKEYGYPVVRDGNYDYGDSSTTKTTSAVSAEIEIVKKRFAFVVPYKNGDTTHHSGLESSVVVRNIADVKHILVNAPESVFNGDVAMIEFDVEWYDEVF